jgi:hypothetical protein
VDKQLRDFILGVIGGVVSTAVGVYAYRSLTAKPYSYLPEPWASATDVITASQYLENAIHDPTAQDTYNDLSNVATQLEHARAYLLTAYTSYGNPTYDTLATYTAGLITQVQEFMTQVQSVTDLSNFQNNTLYPFQAQLGYLYYRLEELM